MGILSSAYEVLRHKIYRSIPEISCRACGQCCVSPHMTLIEFCYLMTPLLEQPERLAEMLSRMVPAHPEYMGNLICRFQTPDSLCGIYSCRPLVCRLHGHPVLKKMGMQYHVFCSLADGTSENFSPEDVYGLMDSLTVLNQGYYSYYTPPYWVSGLNTESWLTILLSDLPQNIFRLLKKIMLRELAMPGLEKYFQQTVRIREKLEVIDSFQSEYPFGRIEALIPIIRKIQNDFPETGAYYYFEAEMYEKALKEKRSIM
ncbi:MAG: YkgJ family cysteine cluster protein [Pseudomonadota bacterium]